MKKWLAVFGSACAVFLAAGFAFTNLIMFMKKKTDEEIMKRERRTGMIDLIPFRPWKKKKPSSCHATGMRSKAFTSPRIIRQTP